MLRRKGKKRPKDCKNDTESDADSDGEIWEGEVAVVRCICGVKRDDGKKMVECDVCKVWSHQDHVQWFPNLEVDEEVDYVCRICMKGSQKCASKWTSRDLCNFRVDVRVVKEPRDFFGFGYDSLPPRSSAMQDFLNAELNDCLFCTSSEYVERYSRNPCVRGLAFAIHVDRANEALVMEFVTGLMDTLIDSRSLIFPEKKQEVEVNGQFSARSDRLLLDRISRLPKLCFEGKNFNRGSSSKEVAGEAQLICQMIGACQDTLAILQARREPVPSHVTMVGLLFRAGLPTVYRSSIPKSFLRCVADGKRPEEILVVQRFTAFEDNLLPCASICHPERKYDIFDSVRGALQLACLT